MAPKPLTAEMKSVMDYMAREDAGLPNPLTLDAPAARKLAVLRNQRWRVDLPPMARDEDHVLPPDPALGTPAVPIKVFVPEGAGSGILLVVHGGGWTNGSTGTHERVMRLLALSSKAPVVGLNYRLAPEDPYPAGLDDVVALFRALHANPGAFGLPAGPIVVTGDSAGANLALGATLREQAEGRPAPAGAVLHYGVLGADFETPSYIDYAEGYGLTTAAMRRYWDWYVPDMARRSEPFANPLAASDAALKALPPLYLLAAECDPLASDTILFKQRLERIGRNDPLHVEPGVVHGFLQMTPRLAAARDCVAASGHAARAMFDAAAKS